jgi:hypothetical protein
MTTQSVLVEVCPVAKAAAAFIVETGNSSYQLHVSFQLKCCLFHIATGASL